VDKPTRNGEKNSRFELKTLLETSRLLIESRETDFVLNNLLLITMGKMLVPRGAILIQVPGKSEYIISKIKGKSELDEGETIEIPWGANDFDGIAIDPVKLNLTPPQLFAGQNRGLFFNLKTSNHHLGYLYLSRKGNNQVLSDHEIEFVESLSIISSVAIANSRMFSEMRAINRKLDRKVYELNTLFDLSKDFSLMVDREKIASTFKFALLGQLLIRKFFLLFNFDDNLELMASSGLLRNPNKSERSSIFDLPDDILELQNEHFNQIPFLRDNEIAALAALQMQGEKIAVVGVSRKANKEELTQPDFNFLQSLGNLAILSIQKTQLLEERIEKERLEEEINIAKKIQKGLFPDTIPDIPSLDLAAKNIPSQQVGGDYYDIVQTPDHNHIIAIGDVTGKGIPAALLMANLQSMLHVLLPVDITLGEATDRINNLIYENTPSDKFITFFWGKFFHSESKLKYINAGHNPPLLLRKKKDDFEELSEGGLILGAMPTMTPYKETDIHLDQDDLLVLFTDGITETFNSSGDEYNETRLKKVIAENRDLAAENLLEAIVRDVKEFSDNQLSDDLTLIVIKGN
jgi:phosphoserine phosphatase RsbU/P